MNSVTNKNILFYVLIAVFVLTTGITLLGVLGIVPIEDFYLKGLFGAFLIELAATVFGLAKKGNLLDESDGKTTKKKVETANMQLHIFGDHRAPDLISSENVFRWYFLQNIFRGMNAESQEAEEHVLCTLFVTFENDVVVSTLKVSSPDMQLPRYEVKEFNQRFAIVVFGKAVPSGTLEIKVIQ